MAIAAKDRETGGIGELVIDVIDVNTERYILVVEAKRSTIAESLRQCVLALKDAYDNNNDKRCTYGFLTTGLSWQLVAYKDGSFNISDDLKVAFSRMKQDFSVVVDALYCVLDDNIKR